ncbi:MAG TPA: hypothetical protein DHV62_06265, partial [Elusimicrobia bacterium]|nr:hypothetical protein [Elusimicrobiota bacterium]
LGTITDPVLSVRVVDHYKAEGALGVWKRLKAAIDAITDFYRTDADLYFELYEYQQFEKFYFVDQRGNRSDTYFLSDY